MEDSPASDISFREGGFVWKSWVEQPIRSLFHYIMAHPHDPACVNIIYPYDITVHLQLYVYILLYSWTSVCSMLLISSRESSFWFVLPAFFGWQCITTIITSQITWRSYIGSACPRHRWVCPKIGYIPQNPMILKLPQERFNLWCQAPATARWLWSSKKNKKYIGIAASPSIINTGFEQSHITRCRPVHQTWAGSCEWHWPASPWAVRSSAWCRSAALAPGSTPRAWLPVTCPTSCAWQFKRELQIWTKMDYGKPWWTMENQHRWPWISMDFHGFSWIFMESCPAHGCRLSS